MQAPTSPYPRTEPDVVDACTSTRHLPSPATSTAVPSPNRRSATSFAARIAMLLLASTLAAGCLGVTSEGEGPPENVVDGADGSAIDDPTVDESDAPDDGAAAEDDESDDDGDNDGDGDAASDDQDDAAGVPDALRYEELAAATYANEWFDEPFALVDGHIEQEIVPGSASKLTADLHPEAAWGDLDGDGDLEAAVVLYISSGGSGTFRHLVAVDDVNGEPRQLGSVTIGDRVEIASLAIEDGQIIVEATTHGPDDPLCCPSIKETLYYGMDAGFLLEIATE